MSVYNKNVIIDNLQITSVLVGALKNLSGLIQRLDIFEDIFSGGLMGNIVFDDSISLSNHFNFNGTEILNIGFSLVNPTTRQRRTYKPPVFTIYRQKDRIPVTQGTEKFTLYFCSPELLYSNLRQFSKTFEDYPHKIVEDLVRKPYGLDSKKPFVELEETKRKIKITLPYMRPYEMIKLLTLQAQSKDDSTNYVFFETLQGYYYVSFRRLLELASKNREEIPTIYMELGGHSEQGNTKTRIKADNLHMVNSFDMLYAASQGYFASTTIAPDVMAGRCGLKINGFGQPRTGVPARTSNFSNFPLYSKGFARGFPATSRIFLVPTTEFSAANTQLTKQDTYITDNFLSRTIDGRNRELLGLQTRTIRGIVPGGPELNPGKIININFPNSRTDKKNVPDVSSGLYMIINTQHSIVPTGAGGFLYETTFEAVSDARGVAL